MTGRTHDLAALTTLTFTVVALPLTPMSVGTLFTAIGANMVGGVTPDIDQPTSDLWRKVPAGSIIGKLVKPFFGAHRSLSHSLLGVALFAFIADKVLAFMTTFMIIDTGIVWSAFMLGLISHLVMDALTKDGIPLLFPISTKFGFPPIKKMRITTGKLLETSFIFPGLLLANVLLIYYNYEKFLDFLKNYIVR